MPTTNDNDRIAGLKSKHSDFYNSIRGLSSKALRERKPALVSEIRRLAATLTGEKKEFSAEENELWLKLNEQYDLLAHEIEEAENPFSCRNAADRAASLQEDANRAASRLTASDLDRQFLRMSRRGETIDQLDGGAGRSSLFGADQHLVNEHARSLAFGAWARTQMGIDISAQEEAACRLTGMRPYRKQLHLALPGGLGPQLPISQLQAAFRDNSEKFRDQAIAAIVERPSFQAALSNQSGPAGAYLFPASFVQSLEINMLAYGGILQACEIMRTSTGERITWPTSDDTGNKGRRIGESKAVSSSTDPTFSAVNWDAYDYTSDAVLVPYRLLEDSVFDLASILGQMLGERLGRKAAVDTTTGSGGNEPWGIVTKATLGKTTASATAITFDEVLDLIASVDPSLRSGGRFCFHDQILFVVRKLKDGQNRYLWDPSTQVGIPDRIWGYPYTILMEMDSAVTTAKKTMLFGDTRRYKFRQVAGQRFYRLEERYRDNDQDGFVAFTRFDGNLLTAGTTPIKYLQQA